MSSSTGSVFSASVSLSSFGCLTKTEFPPSRRSSSRTRSIGLYAEMLCLKSHSVQRTKHPWLLTPEMRPFLGSAYLMQCGIQLFMVVVCSHLESHQTLFLNKAATSQDNRPLCFHCYGASGASGTSGVEIRCISKSKPDASTLQNRF